MADGILRPFACKLEFSRFGRVRRTHREHAERNGIHDRDPLFTDECRRIPRSGCVKTVKLPAQIPDLTACAVCFVCSIREECLSMVIS